jgi:hypothetical protein
VEDGRRGKEGALEDGERKIESEPLIVGRRRWVGKCRQGK